MRSGARPSPGSAARASIAGIAHDAQAGSTVAYAYFPDRDAVFRTAADEDAGGVIREELAAAVADVGAGAGAGASASASASASARNGASHFVRTIADVLARHLLARCLRAGLEPEVTSRALEIPAVTGCVIRAEGLGTDQLNDTVRPDTDPVAIASGIVAIMLFLLMSAVQPGHAGDEYSPGIGAVADTVTGRTPRRSGSASPPSPPGGQEARAGPSRR